MFVRTFTIFDWNRADFSLLITGFQFHHAFIWVCFSIRATDKRPANRERERDDVYLHITKLLFIYLHNQTLKMAHNSEIFIRAIHLKSYDLENEVISSPICQKNYDFIDYTSSLNLKKIFFFLKVISVISAEIWNWLTRFIFCRINH